MSVPCKKRHHHWDFISAACQKCHQLHPQHPSFLGGQEQGDDQQIQNCLRMMTQELQARLKCRLCKIKTANSNDYIFVPILQNEVIVNREICTRCISVLKQKIK